MAGQWTATCTRPRQVVMSPGASWSSSSSSLGRLGYGQVSASGRRHDPGPGAGRRARFAGHGSGQEVTSSRRHEETRKPWLISLPEDRRSRSLGQASRAEALEPDGAQIALSPAEAVADAQVIVTMLADADAVTEAMTAAAPALQDGQIWAQVSTVGLAGLERLSGFASDPIGR